MSCIFDGIKRRLGAVGCEDQRLQGVAFREALVDVVVEHLLGDMFLIELAVAEVNSPVGSKEDQVKEVDGQNPVDLSRTKLCGNAGEVADGDEHDELPAGAGGRACLIVFIGVGRPGQTEAEKHRGFQGL